MTHDAEIPPPGLFEPIMDEASLAWPRDPYTLPVRAAEEWIHGSDIWYPEREIMYDLAAEQLCLQGYDDRQIEVAIMVAQNANNKRIGKLLNISKDIVGSVIGDIYADKFQHPTRAAVTNHVVLTGMRQLVLRSLTERAPQKTVLQRCNEARLILDQRLKNRQTIFRLTPRESEIAAMVLEGLTTRAISKRAHITKDSASQHLATLNVRANCSSRNAFIHRMYGAA